jgi:hypothetical protein
MTTNARGKIWEDVVNFTSNQFNVKYLDCCFDDTRLYDPMPHQEAFIQSPMRELFNDVRNDFSESI